jgi:hypothetical protein
MQALFVIQYSRQDIVASLLSNSPSAATVSLYRNGDPEKVQLLMVVRVHGAAADRDAASWIPYTWSSTSGEDLVLFIDHETLLEILASHASELARKAGLRTPGDPEMRADLRDGEITVRAEFCLSLQGEPRQGAALAGML